MSKFGGPNAKRDGQDGHRVLADQDDTAGKNTTGHEAWSLLIRQGSLGSGAHPGLALLPRLQHPDSI